MISARKMPTVAIATVFQVASAASFKNSSEWAGGKNVARNCLAALRLDGSKSTSGLNSAKYPTGSNTTTNRIASVSLPFHAGSRHRSEVNAPDISSSVSAWFATRRFPAMRNRSQRAKVRGRKVRQVVIRATRRLGYQTPPGHCECRSAA